jgi:hypothetical protein
MGHLHRHGQTPGRSQGQGQGRQELLALGAVTLSLLACNSSGADAFVLSGGIGGSSSAARSGGGRSRGRSHWTFRRPLPADAAGVRATVEWGADFGMALGEDEGEGRTRQGPGGWDEEIHFFDEGQVVRSLSEHHKPPSRPRSPLSRSDLPSPPSPPALPRPAGADPRHLVMLRSRLVDAQETALQVGYAVSSLCSAEMMSAAEAVAVAESNASRREFDREGGGWNQRSSILDSFSRVEECALDTARTKVDEAVLRVSALANRHREVQARRRDLLALLQSLRGKVADVSLVKAEAMLERHVEPGHLVGAELAKEELAVLDLEASAVTVVSGAVAPSSSEVKPQRVSSVAPVSMPSAQRVMKDAPQAIPDDRGLIVHPPQVVPGEGGTLDPSASLAEEADSTKVVPGPAAAMAAVARTAVSLTKAAAQAASKENRDFVAEQDSWKKSATTTKAHAELSRIEAKGLINEGNQLLKMAATRYSTAMAKCGEGKGMMDGELMKAAKNYQAALATARLHQQTQRGRSFVDAARDVLAATRAVEEATEGAVSAARHASSLARKNVSAMYEALSELEAQEHEVQEQIRHARPQAGSPVPLVLDPHALEQVEVAKGKLRGALASGGRSGNEDADANILLEAREAALALQDAKWRTMGLTSTQRCLVESSREVFKAERRAMALGLAGHPKLNEWITVHAASLSAANEAEGSRNIAEFMDAAERATLAAKSLSALVTECENQAADMEVKCNDLLREVASSKRDLKKLERVGVGGLGGMLHECRSLESALRAGKGSEDADSRVQALTQAVSLMVEDTKREAPSGEVMEPNEPLVAELPSVTASPSGELAAAQYEVEELTGELEVAKSAIIQFDFIAADSKCVAAVSQAELNLSEARQVLNISMANETAPSNSLASREPPAHMRALARAASSVRSASRLVERLRLSHQENHQENHKFATGVGGNGSMGTQSRLPPEKVLAAPTSGTTATWNGAQSEPATPASDVQSDALSMALQWHVSLSRDAAQYGLSVAEAQAAADSGDVFALTAALGRLEASVDAAASSHRLQMLEEAISENGEAVRSLCSDALQTARAALADGQGEEALAAAEAQLRRARRETVDAAKDKMRSMQRLVRLAQSLGDCQVSSDKGTCTSCSRKAPLRSVCAQFTLLPTPFRAASTFPGAGCHR